MRFYRSTVEQLLIIATYCKHHAGEGIHTMSERVRYVQSAALGNARKRLLKDANLDTLITQMTKLLDEDTKGTEERDLIDTIISTLQLPYTKNILSGEALRRLRDAVLLPSEMGGLIHRLNQKELNCANCGLPFHDHESVTLLMGSAGQSFVCHRCVAPTCVSCASCAESAALSQKATVAMSRMQCPDCQSKKAGKMAPPVDLNIDEEINSPVLERLRAAARRDGPPPRAVLTTRAWATDASTISFTGIDAINQTTDRPVFVPLDPPGAIERER